MVAKLTPEQQDWVIAHMHVARSVAARYACLLGYDDAYGTALEALCRASQTWDPARVSKQRPNSYIRTTLCHRIVQAANKMHAGSAAVRAGQDPRRSQPVTQNPEDYLSLMESRESTEAIEARIDVRSLFRLAGIRDRVVWSFCLSAEGYPMREHDTSCSYQATKMRQQNAIKKMRKVALGDIA